MTNVFPITGQTATILEILAIHFKAVTVVGG